MNPTTLVGPSHRQGVSLAPSGDITWSCSFGLINLKR